jgi:hypothetical protein
VAVYFNLGLSARTREGADACAAFFASRRLVVGDAEIEIEVSVTERPDGFLVSAWPRGMSYASPRGDDRRLTTDEARGTIERAFDEWLCEAPPFRAAFFGGEAYDFFLDDEIAKVLEDGGFAGLFVDNETWESLGRPAEAKLVAPGRYAWPRTAMP